MWVCEGVAGDEPGQGKLGHAGRALCQAEEFRLYLEGNRDLVTDFKQEDYILRMVFSFFKKKSL